MRLGCTRTLRRRFPTPHLLPPDTMASALRRPCGGAADESAASSSSITGQSAVVQMPATAVAAGADQCCTLLPKRFEDTYLQWQRCVHMNLSLARLSRRSSAARRHEGTDRSQRHHQWDDCSKAGTARESIKGIIGVGLYYTTRIKTTKRHNICCGGAKASTPMLCSRCCRRSHGRSSDPSGSPCTTFHRDTYHVDALPPAPLQRRL